MTRTPWDLVDLGDVIEDKAGRHWTVLVKDVLPFETRPGTKEMDRARFKVTLERGGKQATVEMPQRPTTDDGKPLHAEWDHVEVVERASDAMEMAQAQVAVRLGGTVVAEKDTKAEPWRVPIVFDSAATMSSHLFLLHGVGIDKRPTFATLTKLHDDLHAEAAAGKAPKTHVEHVHAPKER